MYSSYPSIKRIDRITEVTYPVPRMVLQCGKGPVMAAGITTSIRMPEEIRDLYETLSQATGRAKNDLMVEVLRVEGERRVREIALILEGRGQAQAGRLSPLDDVVTRFKTKGMLPADFDLGADPVDPGQK